VTCELRFSCWKSQANAIQLSSLVDRLGFKVRQKVTNVGNQQAYNLRTLEW